MTVMKRVFMVAVMLALLTGTAWAGPVVLKFNTFEPPKGFVLSKILMPFIEKVNKEGEGIIKIDVFAGGALGRNPLKQLKLVKDGVVDIAWIIQSYTPSVFVNDSVLEVPFLAENSMEVSLAFWQMYKKGMLVGYDDIHPLFIGGAQQYNIHTSYPVKGPADLKGVKIRAIGKMQHYFAEALGFTPIGMPVTKIAESISRGLIKGTLNEWNGARTFKIDGVTKYHYMVPLGTVGFLVAMNKAKYEGLSAKAKAILDKHFGLPVVRYWGEVMDEDLGKYHQKILKDPKHHVYTPTGAQMEEWKATLKPAVDSWLRDNPKGAQLLKAFKDELAKVRAGK